MFPVKGNDWFKLAFFPNRQTNDSTRYSRPARSTVESGVIAQCDNRGVCRGGGYKQGRTNYWTGL